MFPSALPSSRVPDPMEAPSLRWAVMGTGWIAERFVAAAHKLTRQQIVAVGSRRRETAAAFAQQHGAGRGVGSYQELVDSPDVDVVYVATPHPQHFDCAMLALRAGKHVLVEKPLGLNADQARTIARTAAEHGLFAMEALWTFFLPKFDVIRQVLADGWLGDVHTVLADNGEWFTPDHRIFRQDLAGGPLMDLGTYPVAVATSILGAPTSVTAVGEPAPNGINGQVAALLTHDSGALSSLWTSILGNSPVSVTVTGTQATLSIDGVFYRPGPFHIRSADSEQVLQFTEPLTGYDGLSYEAAEVARRISDGERTAPHRTLDDSIMTLSTIDTIRQQLDIVWDQERTGRPQ